MTARSQRHTREVRRGMVFTALLACYAAVVLFPVYWMATMMVKPATDMFARPTVWVFEPTLAHFTYIIEHGFAGTNLVIEPSQGFDQTGQLGRMQMSGRVSQRLETRQQRGNQRGGSLQQGVFGFAHQVLLRLLSGF